MSEQNIIINQMIIHILDKEQNGKSEIKLSNKLYNTNDINALKLIKALYTSFTKDISYGIFEDIEADENSFHNMVDKFYNKKCIDFLLFTKESMYKLDEKIKNKNMAKGGYVIFSDVFISGKQYFIIYLVRDKFGTQFDYTGNEVTIKSIKHVDTDKLAMACRIDIDAYKNNEERYLSFISIKQETSNYFTEWIGTKRIENPKNDSDNLKQILNNIDLPIDENGNVMSRHELKQKVIDIYHVANKIDLRNISEVIWGDEAYISNYASENNIVLNSVFEPNKAIIDDLVNFTFDIDQITLKFPSEYWDNEKIFIDPKNKEQIIIKSKELVAKILDRL